MPLVVASQNEPPLPVVLHPAAKLAEIEPRSAETTLACRRLVLPSCTT
jgi:hypothetical protein